MAKYAFQKLIPTAKFAVLGYASYRLYDGYKLSTTPSNFELAAQRLGFTGHKKSYSSAVLAAEQQEALLTQLQMAGYFQPQKLWQDINRLGVKDPTRAFKEIYPALIKSKADQTDPSKFNAKILRKNLCKGKELDEQDSIDLILYLAQHAFTRTKGQERHELVNHDWMTKYENPYFAAAQKLQLIDRISPEKTKYDLCWIAGGCRVAALGRIIDFNYIQSKYGIKIQGPTLVLAGSHELSVSAAGIIPGIRDKLIEAYKTKADIDTFDVSQPDNDPIALKEGEQYLISLAQSYGIKLNPLCPFIQHTSKEQCPPGRNPTMLYANYDKEENNKLTEASMSHDLLTTYSPRIAVKSASLENNQKATTVTTARTGAKEFVESIKNGQYGNQKEFIILLQTNNPFIERQTIASQREINKALKELGLDQKGYKAQVEGIGYKCKQGVKTVHSELAALISEKWETAAEISQQRTGTMPKRLIKDLKFQTRDNDLPVLPYPDMSNIDLAGETIKDLFDEYLP